LNPEAVGFHECIRGLEELSHDGDDGNLCGLSGAAELRVFALEIRVEARGDEGRHIERVAQWLTSPLMNALPFHWPDSRL
jgi:hypothetical protein